MLYEINFDNTKNIKLKQNKKFSIKYLKLKLYNDKIKTNVK